LNTIPQPRGKESHVTGGVIDSTIHQSMSKPSGSTTTMVSQNPSSTTLVNSTSKINVVQSTKGKSQQLGSKKKAKGKKKKKNPL